MYNEDRVATPKNPVGRYVIMRRFPNGVLKRHAESDVVKYAIMCADALIRKTKVNKVQHVQVLDIKNNSLVWEKQV